MLKWVVLIFAAGLAYQPMGQWLITVAPFSKLFAYILCYLVAAGAVASLFLLVKRGTRGKIAGSDAFGKGEYYLGMPAGMVRFSCILIAGLALLNARQYRSEEIKARLDYQLDNYGSDFFPGLQVAQSQVFEQSFLGPHIKKHLSFLLITPTQPAHKPLRRAGEWKSP